MKNIKKPKEGFKQETALLQKRITELEALVAKHRQKEVELEIKALILELATDSIFAYDYEGNLIYVNKAAYESHGYTRDELMMRNRSDLVAPEYVDSFWSQMKEIRERATVAFESVHVRKDGSAMPVEVRATTVTGGGKDFVVGIVRDITRHKAIEERLKKSQAQLEELASRDGLTDLYNYREFRRRLQAELKRSRRYGHPLSLLMVDIDHFKAFNDTYGHQVGNSVLRALGSWIQRIVRDVDQVARYGGEEFTVILVETAASDAFTAAERLRKSIGTEPIAIDKEQNR